MGIQIGSQLYVVASLSKYTSFKKMTFKLYLKERKEFSWKMWGGHFKRREESGQRGQTI